MITFLPIERSNLSGWQQLTKWSPVSDHRSSIDRRTKQEFWNQCMLRSSSWRLAINWWHIDYRSDHQELLMQSHLSIEGPHVILITIWWLQAWPFDQLSLVSYLMFFWMAATHWKSTLLDEVKEKTFGSQCDDHSTYWIEEVPSFQQQVGWEPENREDLLQLWSEPVLDRHHLVAVSYTHLTLPTTPYV